MPNAHRQECLDAATRWEACAAEFLRRGNRRRHAAARATAEALRLEAADGVARCACHRLPYGAHAALVRAGGAW